jgi:hypothetical protein
MSPPMLPSVKEGAIQGSKSMMMRGFTSGCLARFVRPALSDHASGQRYGCGSLKLAGGMESLSVGTVFFRRRAKRLLRRKTG